jgi:hypothetical protein
VIFSVGDRCCVCQEIIVGNDIQRGIKGVHIVYRWYQVAAKCSGIYFGAGILNKD